MPKERSLVNSGLQSPTETENAAGVGRRWPTAVVTEPIFQPPWLCIRPLARCELSQGHSRILDPSAMEVEFGVARPVPAEVQTHRTLTSHALSPVLSRLSHLERNLRQGSFLKSQVACMPTARGFAWSSHLEPAMASYRHAVSPMLWPLVNSHASTTWHGVKCHSTHIPYLALDSFGGLADA